jgi:hypothetical protein
MTMTAKMLSRRSAAQSGFFRLLATGLATVTAAAVAADLPPAAHSAAVAPEVELAFDAASEQAQAEENADWQTITPAEPQFLLEGSDEPSEELAWADEVIVPADMESGLFELLDPAEILSSNTFNFLAYAAYVEPELLAELDGSAVVTADESSADGGRTVDQVAAEDEALIDDAQVIAPDAPAETDLAPMAPDAPPELAQAEPTEAPPEPAIVEENVIPPSPEEPPPAPPSQFRPITAIKPYFDYDPDGKSCEHLCPEDPNCPAEGFECPDETPFVTSRAFGRHFAPTHFMWMASNLYHRPLYFEDVQLERYGQVKCNEWCQAAESLGKFGVQLAALPYQVALDYPWAKRYSLGYYRPGDCAPKLHYQVPLNCKAAVTATAFYTGIVFLF